MAAGSWFRHFGRARRSFVQPMHGARTAAGGRRLLRHRSDCLEERHEREVHRPHRTGGRGRVHPGRQHSARRSGRGRCRRVRRSGPERGGPFVPAMPVPPSVPTFHPAVPPVQTAPPVLTLPPRTLTQRRRRLPPTTTPTDLSNPTGHLRPPTTPQNPPRFPRAAKGRKTGGVSPWPCWSPSVASVPPASRERPRWRAGAAMRAPSGEHRYHRGRPRRVSRGAPHAARPGVDAARRAAGRVCRRAEHRWRAVRATHRRPGAGQGAAVGDHHPASRRAARSSSSASIPTTPCRCRPVGRPMQAGWYGPGPTPGEDGAAVILGHVNGNRKPGIFARLHELWAGDEILVWRADGSTAVFTHPAHPVGPQARFPFGGRLPAVRRPRAAPDDLRRQLRRHPAELPRQRHRLRRAHRRRLRAVAVAVNRTAVARSGNVWSGAGHRLRTPARSRRTPPKGRRR